MNVDQKAYLAGKSLGAATKLFLLLGMVVLGLRLREARDMPETGRTTSLFASNDQQIDIAEADYFSSIEELLKVRYVEQVKDDQKLLSGAVRGTVLGLRDINSQFFNPNEFEALKSIRAGIYPGIGVWLDYVPVKTDLAPKTTNDSESDFTIPRLSVISVAENSPAAKAGVKVGDILTEIDGLWVTNSEDLLKYRKAQAEFLAKKIDFKVLNDLRKELKKKVDKSTTPVRARERAIAGTTGTTTTKWLRAGKELSFTLSKASTEIPTATVKNGAYPLLFVAGAPAGLTEYMKGKSEITLDLRNNVLGDFETMRKCLALVSPAGTYGYLESARTPQMLKTVSGNAKPPKIKLMVDASTRDVAEVFALALSSKGLATLTGGEMSDRVHVREFGQLPDGSGYAIVTGVYKPGTPPTKGVKL